VPASGLEGRQQGLPHGPDHNQQGRPLVRPKKKSAYSNSLIVVVRDWDTEHQLAWLSYGNPRAEYGGAHVCVQYANGAGLALAKCWRNDPPRREDLHYTSVVRTSKLGITVGGLRPEKMTEERQEHVLEADSTEECDAWDDWVAEIETVRQLLFNVWKEAEVLERGCF
jgi:hypothetical protein